MNRYLLLRVLHSLVALWGIVTIVFILLHVGPDPIQLLVPPEILTSRALEDLRGEYGFTAPFWLQYAKFLADVLTGSFGRSIYSQEPAMSLVIARLPATAALVLLSTVMATVVGGLTAILAALGRGSVTAIAIGFLALLGQSVAPFLLGLGLVLVFSVTLRWFPPSGMSDWTTYILPTVTLSAYPMAQVARLLRSKLIDVMAEDYVRVAHAKGLSRTRVVGGHVLPNALIPTITLVGVEFGRTFGATIIVETIFAWPGIGRLMYLSISNRDFPVVLAATFVLAAVVLITNLVVDVTYALLDPRLRVADAAA